MALILALTVSTTAFEGTKEKFYGFRQTEEFEIVSNFQNDLNFDHFAKIAYKIAKSKYFSDI